MRRGAVSGGELPENRFRASCTPDNSVIVLTNRDMILTHSDIMMTHSDKMLTNSEIMLTYGAVVLEREELHYCASTHPSL